jgi:hypothetical protein
VDEEGRKYGQTTHEVNVHLLNHRYGAATVCCRCWYRAVDIFATSTTA